MGYANLIIEKDWMRRASIFISLLGLTFCLLAEEALSPRHREWLENVSPIITRTEREIFSKLKTDADRDKFIQFFWRQRDPYPDTSENEFYKEYMARVHFADQNFGREGHKRGSHTDRGYYYLLLGAPLERNFFTTLSQVWPLELWFYKGEIEYGLPAYFYLIFYQPEGLGEYRLYSPGVEGPEKLVIPAMVSGALNRNSAYQVIKKINAELASASLSYLPGEQALEPSAFSSASILASIHSLPEKKYSDSYARSYLRYKDYVETEYSHAFIESSFMAKVFWQSGQFFLHWALEPKKINFVSRGDRAQAVYDLILRLEDLEGNLVLEKEEEIPLAITSEQYKEHERQVFAFQDILPVIPGRFKLFGLLKNKSAQDFSYFSREIEVPQREDMRPSDLILYLGREKMSPAQSRSLRAFAFGGSHYLVNTGNNFPGQGKMGAFLQIHGLKEKSEGLNLSVLLELRPADAEAVAFSQKWALSEAQVGEGGAVDVGPVSLSSLKPGYYSAELSLVNENNQKLVSARENFVLLAQPFPVLPWVYSKTHPAFPNPDHLVLLSSECFLARRYDEAYKLASQALSLRDELKTRILLGKILYGQGKYQESLNAVLPTYEATPSREAAKVIAASYAGLKDWTSSLVYLEKLLAEATEVSVLNLAGECYLNLGQPERALPLLHKSLELDPGQAAIRALVDRAEKKKS
jgi:GWxTD domain-containing protein